nr:MAG TPA: hypothetical protein [Caudoviricetes sp.]
MKKYIPYLIVSDWNTFSGTPVREHWYECKDGYAVQTVDNIDISYAKSYDTEEEAIARAKELAKTFDEKRYSIGKCSFYEYETEEEKMDKEFKLGMLLYIDERGNDNRPLRVEVCEIDEKRILLNSGEETIEILLHFRYKNVTKDKKDFVFYMSGRIKAEDIGKHIFLTEEEAIEKIEKIENEIKVRQKILEELKQ